MGCRLDRLLDEVAPGACSVAVPIACAADHALEMTERRAAVRRAEETGLR